MCLLNEISQFNSVKHTVQLQVGVEAKLSWKMIQGYDGTVETELELITSSRLISAFTSTPMTRLQPIQTVSGFFFREQILHVGQ